MEPFKNHPLRFELNDEVHARPPEALSVPSNISFLAMTVDDSLRDREVRHLADLAERFGVSPPSPGFNHHSIDLGSFRLKWERHAEFTRYMIVTLASGEDLFAARASNAVPEDWLAGLPGELIVATHAVLSSPIADLGVGDLAVRYFASNTLIGASVADGRADAFTDARIHADGFGRVVVFDKGMTARQAGRTIQRLLEIDTYRMMALLALPVARRLTPELGSWERGLAQITSTLARGVDHDEVSLLNRLTTLEAQIDRREADDHFRFSAAEAYYELVRQRIGDLREARIEGLQTFDEFTRRRLAPAMATCVSVAARLRALSERVSRATQLLSTRVDISRQTQNQAVLESMDRRAALQLRLEETVEGLSVAAITYYIVGLVGYAAKALKAVGVHIDPELAMGLAIPVVVGLTAFGIHRIRASVASSHKTP
jgi:uncharacterized membrane-anchored protein